MDKRHATGLTSLLLVLSGLHQRGHIADAVGGNLAATVGDMSPLGEALALHPLVDPVGCDRGLTQPRDGARDLSSCTKLILCLDPHGVTAGLHAEDPLAASALDLRSARL